MQVTETLSQGLKREYNVVISAGDLATKLDTQLADLKTKVRINGFRPGKVPVAHLKKVYGRSVMADVVQETINAAHKEIVEKNGLRLAQEPKVELPTVQSEIEAALEARGDLAFKVALEVLPQFEIDDFKELALERPVAEVAETEVDERLNRLADGRREFTDRPAGETAETGDRVTVDFNGTIDGVAFEGGEGKDIQVILGSNTFIPGFEDALVGVTTGEQRVVKATFPENYSVDSLAGKTGEFDTTVKAIGKPAPLEINDEFAKGLGVELLEALRKTLRERIEADYARASREKVKRRLLDALAARYSFEVPDGLVTQEFNQIWSSGRARAAAGRQELRRREHERGGDPRRVSRDRRASGPSRPVARRGRQPGAGQGFRRGADASALIEQARQFPGQEKQIWDFYRNNQQALASLRAPIFEEKVVDHILGLANVAETKVDREELFKAEEEPKAAALA